MNDFRDLEGLEFEVTRRGYSREQVDAYLADLRAELASLQSQLAEPADVPGDGSYPEPVQAELDRVSLEVEAIVNAAREAAEGLRTRAAAEASRWREEADSDARRWRSEAEEESARLRSDAEATAERLVTEAEEDSSRRRSDAEAYAARVREETDIYAQQTRQAAESEGSQVKEEADAYAARVREETDIYAQQTRQAAESEGSQVKEEADAYARQTRQSAEEESTELRQEADAYAARVNSAADAYAEEVGAAAAATAERTTAEAESVANEARVSADEYASALRQSADAETTRQRIEAQAAAETARASVWDEATAILNNVAHEMHEVRERTENEALAIIAEGEQQSHRLVSQARQSAEEQRRAARIEADRLVGDAQAQHDEIIETANRAAAAAQERAQALERRREELMGQLEKTQKAMRTLEEELETRRGTLRDREVPADSSTVKIVPQAEAGELAGVRVIPSVTPAAATPVTAEQIMDEVRSLREQREEAGKESAGTGPEPPEAEPVTVVDEAQAPAADIPPAIGIDALFANLRQGGEPAGGGADGAGSRPRPAIDIDPDQLRERLLLPIQNRAHREIKRQLTEQQNVALEQLRVAGAEWSPDPAAHAEAFGPAITELVVESTRAGYLAARELGIRSEGPPDVPVDEVEVPAAGFATDLTEAVSDALERSRGAGEPIRKVSATASRVYRSWRTDSAELRLREMSDVAYADALRNALRQEGYEDTEWALGDWASARHAS